VAGCSRIACAFVPLNPNAETAARRGRSSSGHGTGSAATRRPPSAQSTCEVGVPACRVAGSASAPRASTAFITPATPAAAWVWPMFDFTEPTHTGRSSGRSRP
jgi:hypothetical protein